jgi:hypothetical protein
MVLVNSVFHTSKNFPEDYLQYGHAPSKCLQAAHMPQLALYVRSKVLTS